MLYRIELCFNQKLTPRKFRVEVYTNLKSILPAPLITVQIHSIKHLGLCIQHSGSLYYSSTWEAERSYRKIKRITKGTVNYNESTIIKIQDKESSGVYYTSSDSFNTLSSTKNDKRYTSLENKEISFITTYGKISFQGETTRSVPQLNDKDILSIICLLSKTNSDLINNILLESLTGYIIYINLAA
ncbi:hypothetical protein WA158_003385 [Blastocystis sp. Blastoise]